MSKSYQYTKRFIDREVKQLNNPLTYTKEVRDIIENNSNSIQDDDNYNNNNNDGNSNLASVNQSKIKSAIFKCNILIKRHNRNVFSSQIINQIIQQILKSEQAKLIKVNESFMKINLILQPILLPDLADLSGDYGSQINDFNELVEGLPELKYLLIKEDEEDPESENNLSDNNEEEKEESHSNLVLDDQERLNVLSKKKLRRKFNKEMKNELNLQLTKRQTNIDELLDAYDEVRTQLIDLNKGLAYKYNKLQYLKQLKQKLINTFDIQVDRVQGDPQDESNVYDSDEEFKGGHEKESVPLNRSVDENKSTMIQKIQSNLVSSTKVSNENNLFNEINRFKVLVEKISYKLQNTTNKQELREALSSINRR